ncbi:putative UPF0481 protein [Cinnamomum micranthum f. kanehirae]|uniref:Putative UPF0481 protein n=1 Tax=Cinnamomum micranthum f. kanehirae TaxID=337451 RepID=A0A3S3MW52_9MAGN|nr:putative UPF0481 protein [Cinnamomum micranthum f. kanehirae]
MSFNDVDTPTTLNPNPVNELQWVIQIRKTLDNDDDLEDEASIPFIFNVPKILMLSKPEAYIPQLVAIGPYHHWRPELYEMERNKLAAARTTQKQLHSVKFQELVDNLVEHELRIRSYYHRYLHFNGETLAWMMAVDASFLLEFLQIFTLKEGKFISGGSSRMSHLIEYAGRRSAQNAILRDILMLENQIPLFILKMILELQCSSSEECNELFFMILMNFIKEISPFKMTPNFPHIQVMDRAHLLELLYHLLIPKLEEQEILENEDQVETAAPTEKADVNLSPLRQLLNLLWRMVSSLKWRPLNYVKKTLTSRPVMLVVKLPWTMIRKMPGFSILIQPIDYFFNMDNHKSDGDSSNENSNRPPLIEEITIPSVSELFNAGVKFAPMKGDISTIAFDQKTVTFYLPVVSLDVNTETILRNLVAFEASTACGPLVLTRYTELMNGIIDSEDDAKFLRNKGIVINCLKTDAEVASLWNGMSKSVRLTKVSFLDKVIEDVNRYYGSRWKIKRKEFDNERKELEKHERKGSIISMIQCHIVATSRTRRNRFPPSVISVPGVPQSGVSKPPLQNVNCRRFGARSGAVSVEGPKTQSGSSSRGLTAPPRQDDLLQEQPQRDNSPIPIKSHQSRHRTNGDDDSNPLLADIKAQNLIFQKKDELIRQLRQQLQERMTAPVLPSRPPSVELDLRHVLNNKTRGATELTTRARVAAT